MNTNVKILPTIGIAFLLCAPLILTGCTTMETTAVGTAMGAGLGAVAGHQSGRAGEGAAIGAGVGALTGALVGSTMENQVLRAERRGMERGRRVVYSAGPPYGPATWVDGHYQYVRKREWVDTTTTERVWVKEYWDGNRRIEGHYEVRRIPSGYWREYEERIWVPGHYR